MQMRLPGFMGEKQEMVGATQKPSLSILIPTYKRARKLIRNMEYLRGLIKNDTHRQQLSRVQIIVADGTPSKLKDDVEYECLNELIKQISCQVNLRFLQDCQEDFFSRLNLLCASAQADLVALLGDEDLFVFDHLDEILRAFSENKRLGTVTGRFADIHGFFDDILKMSFHEGWVGAYQIGDATGIERFLRHESFAGFGFSSISYGVIRRSILSDICNFVEAKSEKFTYCGFEIFMNAIQVWSGELLSMESVLYLRDRTWVDRSTSESKWENLEEKTQVPLLIADFLVDRGVFESKENALNAIGEQINSFVSPQAKHLHELRAFMDYAQPFTSNYIKSILMAHTYEQARAAWKNTAHIVYRNSGLNGIGIRSPLMSILSRAKRKLKAAWLN